MNISLTTWAQEYANIVCKDYGIPAPRVIVASLRDAHKDTGRYFSRSKIIYLHFRKNGSTTEHTAALLHELGHYIDHVYHGREGGRHDTFQTLIVESLYRSYGIPVKVAMFIEEIFPHSWKTVGWGNHNKRRK